MREEKNIAEEREMGWFLGQFKANGIFCIKGRFSRLPGLGGGGVVRIVPRLTACSVPWNLNPAQTNAKWPKMKTWERVSILHIFLALRWSGLARSVRGGESQLSCACFC